MMHANNNNNIQRQKKQKKAMSDKKEKTIKSGLFHDFLFCAQTFF